MKRKKFHLLCYHTEKILYEGWFGSIRECVERAVAERVCLDGVDLRHANLGCANLDDAQMAGARLHGANLRGANLSEAVFDYADFTHTDVAHACFAMSSLLSVDFTGAGFGATDVTDAVIRDCGFSCPSVFTTQFIRARIFSHCRYADHGQALSMQTVPVVIQGLSRDIVYLDHHVKIGRDFVRKADLCDAGMAHLRFLYGAQVAAFLYAAIRQGRQEA